MARYSLREVIGDIPKYYYKDRLKAFFNPFSFNIYIDYNTTKTQIMRIIKLCECENVVFTSELERDLKECELLLEKEVK